MKRYIVDSNGWISYFANDAKSALYAQFIEADPPPQVPCVVAYEVHRWALREIGEDNANLCIAAMQRCGILPLTASTAILAADLAHTYTLPACDAMIYAISIEQDAILVTSDEDLQHLPCVEYHEDPRKEGGARKTKRAKKRLGHGTSEQDV